MAKDAPILDYLPPESRLPGRLTLEEGADFVRVTFPVLGAWGWVLPIWITGGMAILNALLPIGIAARIWHATRIVGLHPQWTNGLLQVFLILLLPRWGESLFWLFWSVFSWRKYRRWGRVPRILTATKEGLYLSYLGWWRMRQKYWPAGEITAIELLAVRGNLTWWQHAADLRVVRRKGSVSSFRLSSKNQQLPGLIAERFRSMLGDVSQSA